MTSPLVTDIRTRIRTEERALTPIERVLLAATILKPTEGPTDALDELLAARDGVRTTLPTLEGADRAAVRRLLGAVAAILDAAPHAAPLSALPAQVAAAAAARGAAAAAPGGRHWSEAPW